MPTVLEKCGITNKVINNLIQKGLFVPKKVKAVKKPIRSPSEKWFYQVADRFTPPLTKQEREFYIKNPNIFCKHLIRGVKFLAKACELLHDASGKARELSPKEAITALLVIQRIFHAVLDYNHLKYDRHLEYHDYEKSPVGYYWKKLKRLCLLAAKNAKISNPQEFVNEKMLELISGYGIVIKPSKSKKIANKAYKFTVRNLKNKQLTKELRSLVKIFRQFSLAQKKEGDIFYGGLPPRNIGVTEGGFRYWSHLKSLIENNPNLVKPKYRSRIDKWFKSEEMPQIIVAARRLIQFDADPFAHEIQSLYNEELKRWMS